MSNVQLRTHLSRPERIHDNLNQILFNSVLGGCQFSVPGRYPTIQQAIDVEEIILKI
jgi:hypothetical protein